MTKDPEYPAKPAPCCATLDVMSRPRRVWIEDDETPPLTDEPTDWDPLIEWTPHVGAYCIGHVAIFFCPWCGGKLPDERDRALAEVKKLGPFLAIEADGSATYELEGRKVDAGEYLAKLVAGETEEARRVQDDLIDKLKTQTGPSPEDGA